MASNRKFISLLGKELENRDPIRGEWGQGGGNLEDMVMGDSFSEDISSRSR